MSISATTSATTAQFVNPSIATTGSDDSSFLGMLWDTVNPLQHIPVISDIYRKLNNETINPIADIAGSTLYGGPIGGAIAIASEIGHAIFSGDTPKPSATAQATTAMNLAAGNVGTYKILATTQDWLKGDLGSANNTLVV